MDGIKRSRPRDRAVRAMPAPEANAELQANLDVCPINCFLQQNYFILIEVELRKMNLFVLFPYMSKLSCKIMVCHLSFYEMQFVYCFCTSDGCMK